MTQTSQITERIKHPTPLYAVVGAGDAVVERIRGINVDLDPKHLQEQAKEFPTKAQTVASERFGTVVEDVKHLPEQLRTLPDRAQSAALHAMEQASEVYADLAERGEEVVHRVRKQDGDDGTGETAKKTTKPATTKAKTSASSRKSTTSRAKKSTESAS